jgi:2-alkyl-3-oxoalkanoate reductase
MRVLVTGATGFLGRRVVTALLDRGHDVRVLVRPATDMERMTWASRVEVVRGDLRAPGDLQPVLEEVDCVVHLAAVVAGSDEARFAGTVRGTENLLAAMAPSNVRRLVLASSFSVYDGMRCRGTLDEKSPLEKRLYDRDSYAVAKIWQERIVRRFAETHDKELAVLRPGFIWGERNRWCEAAGIVFGRWYVVNGPLRRLPLTHVENCAEAFALAADSPHAKGKTFNIVDGPGVRAWTFVGDYTRQMGKGRRIPIPYHAGFLVAIAAKLVSKVLFGEKGKLPGVLLPRRHRARFYPLRFSAKKAMQELGWHPRPYRACVAREADTRSGDRNAVHDQASRAPHSEVTT